MATIAYPMVTSCASGIEPKGFASMFIITPGEVSLLGGVVLWHLVNAIRQLVALMRANGVISSTGVLEGSAAELGQLEMTVP